MDAEEEARKARRDMEKAIESNARFDAFFIPIFILVAVVLWIMHPY